MAKPASVPEWNSGGANNIEPSGGKKILGWVNSEQPPSATLNWWQKLVYEWLVWVNAGIWEAVSLDLTGDLQVDGDANVDGTLSVTSAATFEDDVALHLGATISADSAAPNASVLLHRNIHKGHAIIVLNGTGSPAVASNDKLNVSSVSAVGSSTKTVTVVFATAFGSSCFPVATITLGWTGSNIYVPRIAAVSQTQLVFQIDEISAGTIDPTSGAPVSGMVIHVHFEGRQV